VAKYLSHEEIASLAADMAALLKRIDSEELSATAAMRHRIEGAIAAINVVQGETASINLQED
jgi:hypothetical protein